MCHQDAPAESRYEVVVEQGPPHGDLYEMEQTTTYTVIERATGRVVMTFQGTTTASLDRDSALWGEGAWSGARDVRLAPDGLAAVVTWEDGREERVGLDESPCSGDG